MKMSVRIAALVFGIIGLVAMKPMENRQAVVIQDSGCQMLLSDGKTPAYIADRDVRIYNAGRKIRVCHGTIANPTGRTIHFDYNNTGMMCQVNGGTTDVWKQVISASGEATLHCRL